MGYQVKGFIEIKAEEWQENDKILLEYQGYSQAVLKEHKNKLILKVKTSDEFIWFFEVTKNNSCYDFENEEELKIFLEQFTANLIVDIYKELKYWVDKHGEANKIIFKQQKLLESADKIMKNLKSQINEKGEK